MFFHAEKSLGLNNGEKKFKLECAMTYSLCPKIVRKCHTRYINYCSYHQEVRHNVEEGRHVRGPFWDKGMGVSMHRLEYECRLGSMTQNIIMIQYSIWSREPNLDSSNRPERCYARTVMSNTVS